MAEPVPAAWRTVNLIQTPQGTIQLQATLAATTAGSPLIDAPIPHHPITCYTELRYEEDGSFSCEHVTVSPDDRRTQASLDASAAILILELANGL